MNELTFSFDILPWEEEIHSVEPGGKFSASRFLALMEEEDPLAVEDALSLLDSREITLDVEDLPPAELTGSDALRLKQEAGWEQLQDITGNLEKNDPLRLYLQELATTPAAGDPQLLADRYVSGEHHVAEQLVNLCLGQVVQIAKEYTGHGVLMLDLIQEGSLGLWQSILNYTQGDFCKYADTWIRRYMAKAVTLQSRNSGVGEKLRQDMADYLDADQKLLAELGRNPTIQELADATHITLSQAEVLEKMLTTARKLSAVREKQQPAEPKPEDEQAVEDTAYFQMRQRIMELLSVLPPEDARILSLRFGLEGGQPLSPVQTGQILNMTPEEVVSREAAALSCLRNTK